MGWYPSKYPTVIQTRNTLLRGVVLTAIFDNNAGNGVLAKMWGVTPGVFTTVTLGVFCTLYGLAFLLCTTLAVMGIRPNVYRATFDPDTGKRNVPPAAARAKVLSAERPTFRQ